jgi:hypothetical protein
LKIVNPLIKFSCEVVKNYTEASPFQWSKHLPSCPIWSNPVLKAGGKTLTNKSWQHRGTNQVGQIVIDGYMVPFNVLKTQYDLKDVDFFACIQFKSNLGLLISKEHIVQDLDLDIKLREIASGRKIVSRLYELLTTASLDSLSSIQHKRELDLGAPLSNAQWDKLTKTQQPYPNV